MEDAKARNTKEMPIRYVAYGKDVHTGEKERRKTMIDIVDDYNPTKGDKIREMPDSELAQIIMCPHDIDPDICIAEKKDCYECCLEYLQQPEAEEN